MGEKGKLLLLCRLAIDDGSDAEGLRAGNDVLSVEAVAVSVAVTTFVMVIDAIVDEVTEEEMASPGADEEPPRQICVFALKPGYFKLST